MSRHYWRLVGLLLVVVLALPAQAGAEAGPKVIPASAEGVQEGTQPGWNPLLKASGNFALGHNDNVPGNQDGLSLQLGYLINAGFGFLNASREHEWITTLLWQLQYARTPAVDVFLKSVDTIDFKTTYLYHIPKVPWLGPFAAFRLSTPMLPAYDARGADTNVLRLQVNDKIEPNAAGQLSINGSTDPTAPAIDANNPRVRHYGSGKKIALTGAGAPLILRESAGLFAMPLDRSWMRIDIRLGFGAWETIVRHGFALEDNPNTADVIELRRMQNSNQAGPEFGILFKGIVEERMTYALSGLLMQPVWNDASTDKKGIDLLNAEFEALIGVRLWTYLSLDYQFKAYRQPLVVKDWQIQNSLLISLNFDVIGAIKPPAPPAAPAPCACPPPEMEAKAETPAPPEAEAPAASEPAPADNGTTAPVEPVDSQATPPDA